jgi:UDP-galactopyranose mutase
MLPSEGRKRVWMQGANTGRTNSERRLWSHMMIECLIIGSGLTGATIARALTNAGKKVLVVDRRSHMGGNIYDHCHESGIRMHDYGPHYFRTNNEDVWRFVNAYSNFYKYEASLNTFVEGRLEAWPITNEAIKRFVGEHWTPEFKESPSNFEEASLSKMPRKIYEAFVKGYTEKQWGVKAKELSAALAKRFDIQKDGDMRLMHHKYQGLPSNGYAGLINNMLSEIPVLLNYNYLKNRQEVVATKIAIYTGPIDEYFDYEYGKLLYRGQERRHQYFPHIKQYQPVVQVNNPDIRNGPHIRTIEWKHMMQAEYAEHIEGTLITTEAPYSPENSEQYEYPFPDKKNSDLYSKYRLRADAMNEKVIICGRLGDYRYYDMDHAIERGFEIAKAIMVQYS